MSYQGSPYSGHLQDDNDLDDDCYDEYEYRDQEEQPPTAMDDSDEDTEEASETDMGHRDEPQEIKEQIYQDKIANLRKQLQQLQDGAHLEYSRRVRRLEQQLSERQQLNIIHRDYLMECVEQDYILEKKAAAKEFEEKKVDLKENLLTDFEDKRKHIESERLTMELNGDSMEVKPAMTRKLRRRPNEPAPAPDKRRKPLPLTLTYLLDDREVEADLRQISRNRPSAPIAPRKQHAPPPSSISHSMGGNNVENRPPSPMAEARVEDGKLLYERRWYHRGQSIYVEGKDYARFPAHISSIGSDCIWVKKSSLDGNKLRINTSQLTRGKMIIKRRAS